MNTDKKIYTNYISSHFGAFHDFDREIGRIVRLFRANYSKILPKDKHSRIIDLGCGMGHFLYYLKKDGYTNYLGVDVSPENVLFCKSKNLNAIESDIFEFLRNNPEKADAFVLNDILEHFEIAEALGLLERIRDSLKPGGRIFIKTPNAANPILGMSSMYQDITHRYCYTQISLSQILKVAGYGAVTIFGQNIYIFTYNPFNYLAKAAAAIINATFRILCLLYGKWTLTIFEKHLIAFAERR